MSFDLGDLGGVAMHHMALAFYVAPVPQLGIAFVHFVDDTHCRRSVLVVEEGDVEGRGV